MSRIIDHSTSTGMNNVCSKYVKGILLSSHVPFLCYTFFFSSELAVPPLYHLLPLSTGSSTSWTASFLTVLICVVTETKLNLTMTIFYIVWLHLFESPSRIIAYNVVGNTIRVLVSIRSPVALSTSNNTPPFHLFSPCFLSHKNFNLLLSMANYLSCCVSMEWLSILLITHHIILSFCAIMV